MSSKDIEERIKDLKFELVKEKVNLAKGGKTKVKEIKHTIARLHTFNRLKELQKNKSVDK